MTAITGKFSDYVGSRYADKLYVPDEDRAEFEALRGRLSTQFAEASVLEETARERVIACVLRVKVALRLGGWAQVWQRCSRWRRVKLLGPRKR